jgi:hypothetical protein
MQGRATRELLGKRRGLSGGKRRRKPVAKRDEYGELAAHDQWDAWNDEARAKRIRRALSGKRRSSAANAGRVRVRHGVDMLGRELGALYNGRKSEQVIEMFCGHTERGIALGADILKAMTHGRFHWPPMICETPIRTADSPCARKFLEYMLRHLTCLERNGPEKISVRGTDAFWGLQHEPVQMGDFEFDCKLAQMQVSADLNGRPEPKAFRVRRRYVATRNAEGKNQIGGMGGRLNRSARQVCNYHAVAKLMGLFQSEQPGIHRPDAIRPKRQGSWAYPEIIFMRSPPESLMKRLVRWWGERKKKQAEAGKPARRKVGEPPHVHEPTQPPGTGPPDARLYSLEPLQDEREHILSYMSMSDADDYEQLCGFPS